MLGYKAIGVSGCWGWSHNKAMIEDFKSAIEGNNHKLGK